MADHQIQGHKALPEETQSWQGDFDPFADREERRVLFAALDSFRQYRRSAHLNNTHRRRQSFYALPQRHWQMLAEPPFSILENFDKVDDAIDTNSDIADAILETGLQSFGLSATPDKTDPQQNWHDTATGGDMGKAHSTIRQFYRDWSEEGKREREVCYNPVLAVLNLKFGDLPNRPRSDIRVLVPGAGLGRLVFDICAAGYTAEGNEISYHQLLASSWILNHSRGTRQHALYPFALQFSNILSRKQQLQKVMIPDVHPASAMHLSQIDDNNIPSFGNMSMSAADFIPLYSQEAQKEAFDAIATVFFIDTSPNLIRYIETIKNCLKPGGRWINVGPLLWHFGTSDPDSTRHSSSNETADAENSLIMQNDGSTGIGEPGNVELSEEEVFHLVQRMGFTFEVQQPPEDRPYCGYIQDPESMLQNLYRPSLWVARKL
ncbi:N2227-like protein-domain-containing protein [Talaromyces proteolyticus]|uniref:carnosine N-methyltransferase n=1 Tax=Talaromyces proteolyticus TaxID=1131652 RepID=A0AAD4KRN4_9EURO|nr:N2227-like protein-domain-containing protein [Talaromyces proteolyticus]KAH8698899.1 N2227-like protein-domain-containing protein [Talaromyces proteolyticus]